MDSGEYRVTLRRRYHAAPEPVLTKAEALFASWRAHLDARRAQKLQGQYPSDEVLAEAAIDAALTGRGPGSA